MKYLVLFTFILLVCLGYSKPYQDTSEVLGAVNYMHDRSKRVVLTELDSSFWYLKRAWHLADSIGNDSLALRSCLLHSYIYRVCNQQNLDSALYWSRRAIVLAKEKESDYFLVSGWNDLAKTLNLKGSMDSAVHYYTKSYQFTDSVSLREARIWCIMDLSLLYQELGLSREATLMLENYLKKDSLSHESNFVRLNLAAIYSENELYDASFQLITQALEAFKAENVKGLIYHANQSLAAYYVEVKEYEKAEELIDDMQEKFESLNFLQGVMLCLELRCRIELKKGDYAKLMYLASDLIEKSAEINYPYGKIWGNYYLGKSYIETGRYHLGKDLLLSSLDYESSAVTVPNLLDVHLYLWQKSEKLGRSQSVIYHMQEYYEHKEVRDSIRFNALLGVSKTKLEKENERLELKAVQQHVKILKERSKFRWTLFMSFGALFIVILFFFYLRVRSLNRFKRIAIQQYDKLKDELTQKNVKLYDIENSRHVQLTTDLDSLKTIDIKKDWLTFNVLFLNVFPDFFEKLERNASQTLTHTDKRLAMLIKLELSNKEMVDILGITMDGLKKGKKRLKSKLNEIQEPLPEFIKNV